jgi:iron(III) transport system permease protein
VAALKQIDPAIEEASIDLGATSLGTFRRITLPLITPAFFSGLVFSFVRCMTAISAVIFVVSGRWHLITVAILDCVGNSDLAQAAAFCMVVIAAILIALGILQALVGRVGKGVHSISA